jgi:hypothetical protein
LPAVDGLRWKKEVPTMRLNGGMIALAVSATVLASASAMTGCASGGVVYDPYRHEYHRWNRGEDQLYRQLPHIST